MNAPLRNGPRLRVFVLALILALGGAWLLGTGGGAWLAGSLGAGSPAARTQQPAVVEYTVTVAMGGSLATVAGAATYAECTIAHAIRTPDLLLDLCWTKAGEVRIVRIVRTAPSVLGQAGP